MWETNHVELGRVVENSTTEVFFKHTVTKGFTIDKVESSCGCTTPTYDSKTGYLSAVFTAGTVPKHLEWKGEYNTTKKLIAYTSEGEDVFTLRATIFRQ
jgi:hypothetical protein